MLVKGDQIGDFTIEFDQDCNQLFIHNTSDFPMQFKFLSAETALNGVIISPFYRSGVIQKQGILRFVPNGADYSAYNVYNNTCTATIKDLKLSCASFKPNNTIEMEFCNSFWSGYNHILLSGLCLTNDA